MNKAKEKVKLSLVSGKKKPAASKIQMEAAAPNTVSSEEAALGQLATVEFWKNEISSIRSDRFDSMQQAIDKVIDQVVERLNLAKNGESGQEDVKEFLRLVFESSESLQDALKKTLKIS